MCRDQLHSEDLGKAIKRNSLLTVMIMKVFHTTRSLGHDNRNVELIKYAPPETLYRILNK